MSRFDAFAVFWCGGIVVMAIINAAWAINDLRSRSARMSWMGNRVSRDEEPFEYWLAVGSKIAVIPVAGFMLWFGSGVFRGQP